MRKYRLTLGSLAQASDFEDGYRMQTPEELEDGKRMCECGHDKGCHYFGDCDPGANLSGGPCDCKEFVEKRKVA